MKVATFNLNNINKRLDNLLAWLAKAQPDVVSLQELKAEQEAFPVNALRTLGYEAVWQGERSWNGVAILARNYVPVLTCTSLPGNPEGHYFETRNHADHQARYIEAAVQGVLITSIYLPNGNPQPGPKFNYKLAWFERLIAHATELMASGAPVVTTTAPCRGGRPARSCPLRIPRFPSFHTGRAEIIGLLDTALSTIRTESSHLAK